MKLGQRAISYRHTLFLRQGLEIELIFTLLAAVSEIRADFQNCHIHETWPLAKVPGEAAHTCIQPTLFLPQGGEIELIFALRAAVSEIRADFEYQQSTRLNNRK